MKRIFYLFWARVFSMGKKIFIFKGTEKAIFIFFPNKYPYFLKVLTRNDCNHDMYEFQIEFTLYSLPECQGTPCLKPAPYMKFK